MTNENEKTHFGEKIVDKEAKKGLVGEVFTTVASKYDLMNDLMSFGTHRLWKRHLARKTRLKAGQRALDVAGGTADLAILMKKQVGAEGTVTVLDINEEMLLHGRDKCIDSGLLRGVNYVLADAEAIPLANNTFDCVTIGFGIRNVTDIPKALREMERVTRPGGRVICLEFSKPESTVLAKLYDLYSFAVIPRIGEAITGNRGAYTYLPESIRKFPDQETFKYMMEDAGLFNVKYRNIFGGIAALHIGVKV